MGANHKPVFKLIPNCPVAVIAAANTARDGSGTLVDLFTPSTTRENGGRIEKIVFTSAQAVAAANSDMVGRVFLTDNLGANPRLIREVAIPTTTASDTVVGATVEITFEDGLIVPDNCVVKVSQSIYAGVQDQMHVSAEGGDF